MIDSNVCYSCGKVSHMMKIVQIGEVKNKGRREFNLIVQVKRLQGGKDSSHSRIGVQGKVPLVKSRVRVLN